MEIKFKAWHKKNRKMYFVDAIEWTIADLDKQKIKRVCLGFRRSPFNRWVNPKDVCLKPYIGLIDSSFPPKEIYKDDIVKCFDFDGKEYTAQVKHIGGRFVFDIGHKLINAHSSSKVIGDIHQNPELLKGK